MLITLDILGCARARLRKVPVSPSKKGRDETEKEEVTLFPYQDRNDASAYQSLGKHARWRTMCGDQNGGPIRSCAYLSLLTKPTNRPIQHENILASPRHILVETANQGLEEGSHGGEGD